MLTKFYGTLQKFHAKFMEHCENFMHKPGPLRKFNAKFMEHCEKFRADFKTLQKFYDSQSLASPAVHRRTVRISFFAHPMFFKNGNTGSYFCELLDLQILRVLFLILC